VTDPTVWRRIGVLGGSFDPPHCGHVLLAAYALSVAPVDGVLIVPAHAHAFGKSMAPFEHRVAMVRAAFSVLEPMRVAVSEIERELPPPSFTYRTLEALVERLPHASFRMIVGSDIVKDTSRWTRIGRVTELAPFFVIGRGGHDAPQVESAPLDLPEVSSTVVREALRNGGSVRGLLSSSVEAYVEAHRLYRALP
jgi:nicotinate-nucleotide adenylyltransferase